MADEEVIVLTRQPRQRKMPRTLKAIIAIVVAYMVLTLFFRTNPLEFLAFVFAKIWGWLQTIQTFSLPRWTWIVGFVGLVWVSARFFYLFMPTLYIVDENKFLTVFRTKPGAIWRFYVFEWVDWPPRPRLERMEVPDEWVEFFYKSYVVRHPNGKKLVRIADGRTVKFDTIDREATQIELLWNELKAVREQLEIEREVNLRLRRQLGAMPGWEEQGSSFSE